VLWLVFWGFVALIATGFGGDAGGWAILTASLIAGVLGVVLGISLVRGRGPGKVGWILTGGAILLLVLIPFGQMDQSPQDDSVDRAVETAYARLHDHVRYPADCSFSDDVTNADGSEPWTCSLDVADSGLGDFCAVSITRTTSGVVARGFRCTSDREAP
jgi:hypothetical protein